MDYKFFGRKQGSKRASIKQALQLMLLLVVCAWLLYKINHSRDKTERFGGQIKIFEEYGVVLLGRKGTPSSWLNQLALPDSGNLHFVAEAENATKDSFKGNFGKIHVKSRSESDQKEQETDSEMLVRVNDSSSAIGAEEAEVQVRESLNDVQFREEAKIDGIHGFQDENGVPPEGNEMGRTGNFSSFTFSKETRLEEMNISEVITPADVNKDTEINSESITHADTSGIISHNLETNAGDSSVL